MKEKSTAKKKTRNNFLTYGCIWHRNFSNLQMFVCLSYLNGKTWTVAEQINLTWPSCSLKIRQETLLTQTDIWESESACSWWVELKVTSFRSFLVQVKWRNMLTWKNPTTATSYNHGACHYPLTAMVKTQNRKATPIHRKGGGRMSRSSTKSW